MKRRNLLKYGIEAGLVTVAGVGLVEWDRREESETPHIRPPGAPAESEYLQRCIKCGRCIQRCPVNALGFSDIRDGLLRSGTPALVPEVSGCIAWDEECLVCIEECPVDALEPIPTDEAGIPTEEVIGRAQIDDVACINCSNCYPICPVDAVIPHGESVDGGPERETFSVDVEKCVGCGRCIEICPVDGKAVKLFEPDSSPEYPIRMDEPLEGTRQ